jgi:hypothetical protein
MKPSPPGRMKPPLELVKRLSNSWTVAFAGTQILGLGVGWHWEFLNLDLGLVQDAPQQEFILEEFI